MLEPVQEAVLRAMKMPGTKKGSLLTGAPGLLFVGPVLSPAL